MDTYDPDIAPPAADWLSLDERARMSLAIGAHAGRFPDALHSEGGNEIMHGSLHAIVETQIASGQPPITGQTIDRLMKDGLRRHPAIHMVMHALAQQLVLAGQGSSPEPGHWERTLSGLKAGDAVGEALRGRLVAPEDNDPSNGNRAQRRAAQKAKRRNKPTES